MIADHIIRFIIKRADEMDKADGKINWRSIRAKIFHEWHEDYPEKMLEKLYWTEAKNPEWKRKEVDVPYIDLKAAVDDLQRKTRDKS